jgi:hypothetical protein
MGSESQLKLRILAMMNNAFAIRYHFVPKLGCKESAVVHTVHTANCFKRIKLILQGNTAPSYARVSDLPYIYFS